MNTYEQWRLKGYYVRKVDGGWALYHHNLDDIPPKAPEPDQRIGFGRTRKKAWEIAQEYENRGGVPYWRNEKMLADMKKGAQP